MFAPCARGFHARWPIFFLLSDTVASTRRCPACAAAIPAGVLTCPACGADAPTEIAADGTVPFGLPAEGLVAHRAALQDAIGESFEVRRLLGRGGFGEVWEAYDLRLGRAVAVKVLREELSASVSFRERFRRETRAVAKLRHPGIVPVYHVGEEGGLVYFIMPLVEGVTLKAALEQEGRLSAAEAVRILTEASDALREAHRRGIVHRDLKPENVMLEGAERRVLLMDFGIAQSDEGDQELTGAGLVLGSREYMSPEQAMGARQLDGRSDIYSLGVVGYRMLAGKLPFAAETAREFLAHHAITPPEPLDSVATVPRGLSEAVMRCLEKRPGDRWQTTDELLAALRPTVRYASSPAIPGLPVEAVTTAPSAPPKVPAAAKGRRAAVAVGAVVMASAALVWFVARWSDLRRWEATAAMVGSVYGQVTDSLRALTPAFRNGSLTATEYLAAVAALHEAAEARVAGTFGPVLDDLSPWPPSLRADVEGALHAASAAALPGGELTVQSAGVAGCVMRREPIALVLEDSTAGDNCWWSVSPPPPVALPVEYALSFRVPQDLPRDAGVGLAWCRAAAECRVVFVWSRGRVESAEYHPGVGLRRRQLGVQLPPLTGLQHLRVRAEDARVRVWLGDALVLDRPPREETRVLGEAGALRVVVQNAAIALAPGALQVVGGRP